MRPNVAAISGAVSSVAMWTRRDCAQDPRQPPTLSQLQRRETAPVQRAHHADDAQLIADIEHRVRIEERHMAPTARIAHADVGRCTARPSE